MAIETGGSRAGFWRGGCIWLGLVGALAFACGGRATSAGPEQRPGPGGRTSAGGGTGAGGDPGEIGGVLSSGGEATTEGGAAGDLLTAPCDAACLASVASQNSDFGMPWQSSWFLMGCKQPAGHDCISIPDADCPNQSAAVFEDRGAITLETFPIGGVKGQHYKVTFTFNGLASLKDYTGGTRDQGDAVPNAAESALWDTFYRDGDPTPSRYDPWKLSVLDPAGRELRHYYMNSCPPGMGWESHRTFLLSFTKSIVVVGGGKVTHRVQDPNCHSVDNCGRGNLDGCDVPQNIPNEPDVLPPAMYQDPADGQIKPTTELSPERNPTLSQPWHSQLGHLTITSVEQTTDPITTDYP